MNNESLSIIQINTISTNKYDSIEVVRSRFIRNMWFVDSSVYNHKQHIEYTIKKGFQDKPLSKYSYSNHNTNGSHNMPHYCIVIIKCWFHIDLFECDLMIWMKSIIMIIMIIMIRKKKRKKERNKSIVMQYSTMIDSS